MSSLRDYRKNTKRRRTNAKRPTFWAIEIPVCVGDPVVGLRRRNRPAVGCPPYVCQPVLAFSSNSFGSITHRGGRDARVPVRAASRHLSATPTGVVWFCRCVFSSRCRRAIMIHWRRNRPAVGCPPYVCQPVLAFRSNFFGAITHRGGRDARVPVRAASRHLSATPTGAVWFCQCVFRHNCRRAIMIHWRRNRPAVSYPPYVCQPVLAFSSNFFGAITHRGGRDARVPVRAASRRTYEV
jgi:hypothetical protein